MSAGPELRRLASLMFNAITRGRLAGVTPNARRPMLQLTSLASETKQGVELFMPYGMSAYPAGGEIVQVQIAATRDHMVALLCDDPALRIPDLAEGEFGFRDRNGQQVVFRVDHIEVTTPLAVKLVATGAVSLTSATKIRLQAPILEFQATETYRLDIAGYALEMKWLGGDAYQQTTWFLGAVITPVVNAVSPPGVFDGP